MDVLDMPGGTRNLAGNDATPEVFARAEIHAHEERQNNHKTGDCVGQPREATGNTLLGHGF
ncbi:MAG: hypothetical protein Q8L64_01895 [bacterium]|nr:hypothetical protein [bacterium]